MKKLLTILAALAILASGTANAQVAERLTAHRLDRPWTFSSFVAPTGCVSTSVPFFGADLKLTCDGGITYDSTGRALTTETVKATSYAAQAKTVTITGATNATPIVVTATAHGLYTGDWISISGITGNTNANGFFKVTRLTADTFSLQNYSTGADIAGNGAYGGTPVAVTGIVYAPRVFVGDGTAAQPSVTFGAQSTTGIYRETSGNYAGMTFVVTGTNVFDFVGGTAGGTQFAQIRNGSFKAPSTGGFVWSSTTDVTSADDLILTRPAAATLQLGAANAASPVAQTLKFQDATGSNANAAATATIKAPAGRGTGTRGKLVIQTPQVAASGDNAQTQADRLTIGEDYVDTNIGTGTAVARVGGVLHVNTTSQATTGTSEQVLATYTLPANTLSRDGQAVRVTAFVEHAANTNATTARVRWGGIGGTVCLAQNASASAGVIRLECVIYRTGAATQAITGAGLLATAAGLSGNVTNSFTTGSATLSGTVDIVVTGTTGTAAGDLTFRTLLVEALN